MAHDPRFDELAIAYLTGGITPADMVDFELRLKADPSARTRLAELSEQELALRQIFRQQENRRRLSPDSAVIAVAPGAQREGKSGVTRVRRSRVMRAQRSRRSGGFWVPLALAASLLLCAIAYFVFHRPPADRNRVAGDSQPPVVPPAPSGEPRREPQRKPVGNVIYVAEGAEGSREMRLCRREGERESRLPLVEGMALLAGDRIETGPREPDVAERRPVRAAVAFSAGATLDLADETHMEAISGEEVRVASGLLYAETKPAIPAAALTVRTPHADVRSERVAMDVSVASGGTAVVVETGSASLSNAQGGASVAGLQKSVARLGREPAPPVTVYANAMWRGRKGPAASEPFDGEPAVLSFTLIDADRDEPIAGFDPLPPGEVVLNLAQLPTRKLNIRANTEPESGISVRFDIDKKTSHMLEQIAPYAFNGDVDSDYKPWTPAPGTHVITATPFADMQGRGRPGKALRVTIQVQDR